jgi:hypothetical protein
MSSLVVLCLFSHYRIVLLPHYELVPPPASVGYVQTISNDVARASLRLVHSGIQVEINFLCYSSKDVCHE